MNILFLFFVIVFAIYLLLAGGLDWVVNKLFDYDN